MSASTLTSLAVLNVNWDRLGKDYIENFVPFAVECARTQLLPLISTPELQASIRDTFGLTLPQNTVRQIIRRATRQGYFRRERRLVYKIQEKCDGLAFGETRDAVERTFDAVVNQLRGYVERRHGQAWSSEDAEDALADFLTEDGLSVMFGTYDQQPGPRRDTDRLLIAAFVDHARLTMEDLFEDLLLLARGSMLANAMYLPDPGHVSRRFRRTAVYLDTSLIMFAVGLGGPVRQAPRVELLELLKRQGANLRCFQITRDELQQIVNTCADILRSGNLKTAYGPTIEYFLETGRTASDLELISVQLPQKLHSLGISIVDLPSFQEHEHVIDEGGFETHLMSTIGYTNPRARLHDVHCISAMARIRRKRSTNIIEECGAIFVTTNRQLAMETRRFFQHGANDHPIALAVTDDALGSLLWLKDPTLAPDFARKRLLADAYAATRPSEILWKAYLREIARLRDLETIATEDDYHLLRYSRASKSVLMDLTGGSSDRLTEGTPMEMLEVIKDGYQRDLYAGLEDRDRRIGHVEEQLEESEAKRTATRVRIIDMAAMGGRIFCRTVFLVGLLAITLVVLMSWPLGRGSFPDQLAPYVPAIFVVLVSALVIGNLAFGTTLRDLVDSGEGRVCRWLTKRLFAIAGIEEEVGSDVRPGGD